VKSHPDYDYRVRESTATCCRIEWLQRVDGKWESIGESSWDDEDRERAGLPLKYRNGNPSVWGKYPKAMMFNRAMSNGVAMFVPCVIPTGNRVYTEGDHFGPRDDGYAARVGKDDPVVDVTPEDEEWPLQEGDE